MVARYVVPEINGYVDSMRKSQKFVIENRAVFERAGQAVMAKIMGNEKAAAALADTGPGRVAIPRRTHRTCRRKPQSRKGVRGSAASGCSNYSPAALAAPALSSHFVRTVPTGFAAEPTTGYLRAPSQRSTGAICHVDAECGLSRDQLHAAEAQFADAYSRRRGLADHRQDARGAGRSQGPHREATREIRAGLSHPSVRRDQPRAARPRGQRARAVRPGQAVLLDARLGPRFSGCCFRAG